MIKIENLISPSPKQFEIVIKGMRNAYKSNDKSDSDICINSEEEKETCYECPYVDQWVDEAPFSRPICYIDTYENGPVFILGKNDKKLAENLISGDSPSHRKFLRQLPVIMDITAPLYFWKQLDTYKIGTTANSESTMHCLVKDEFKLEDFSFDYINEAETGEINNGLDWENKVAIDTTQIIVNNLNFLRNKAIQGNKAAWHMINELLPQSYNQKRTWSANYEVLLTIINQRIHHKLPEWRDLIICWLQNIPYLLEFALADGVIKKIDSNIVFSDTEDVLYPEMKKTTKNDVPEVLELLPEIEKLGGKIIRGEQIPLQVSEKYIEMGIIDQQNLVFFPNGYGASIVRCFKNYGYELGLMELAIIRITDKDAVPMKMWDFYYNNPIAGDSCILGYQSKSDMMKVLKQISELDPHEEELSES